MGFILTVIGTLLLLLSLVGIVFGVFMAADSRTRESGVFFAISWVPAVAAAGGVLMRDAVTFTVGLLCFLVAGTVFTFEGGITRRPSAKRRIRTPRSGHWLDTAPARPEETSEETPEETAEEAKETVEGDKPGGYGRAAS